MHFSLIDYLLWFASPLLQAGVLIVLFRRGLYRHLPVLLQLHRPSGGKHYLPACGAALGIAQRLWILGN